MLLLHLVGRKEHFLSSQIKRKQLSIASARNRFMLYRPWATSITQVCTGRTVSSGSTACVNRILAEFTGSGCFCALVDAASCFDAVRATISGVELGRVLWIRCRQPSEIGTQSPSFNVVDAAAHQDQTQRYEANENASESVITDVHTPVSCRPQLFDPLEQAFKAADILVQNGGFELIAVDLCNVDKHRLRKIPLTTWFRFARVAKAKQIALVFLLNYPAANICADLTVQMSLDRACWSREANGVANEESDLYQSHEPRAGVSSIKKRPRNMKLEKNASACGNELLSSLNPPAYRLRKGAKKPSKRKEEAIGSALKDFIGESKQGKVSPHTEVLKGAECRMEIKREKKPVEPVRPNFTALCMWK